MWDLEALFFQGSKGGILFFSSFPNFSNFERGCAGRFHGSSEPIGGNKVIPRFPFWDHCLVSIYFVHSHIPT